MMTPENQEKRGRVRGLSCGQMILLFLFVVIVALGAAVALGFAIGIFEPDQLPFMRANTQEVVPTELAETPGQEKTVASSTITVTVNAEGSLETPAPTTTAIPSPTITATLGATSTPPPTAPADVCAQVNLSFVNATSNVITWRLGNPSGQPFVLQEMELVWPIGNDAIFNVFIDGAAIWSGEDLLSPTFISSWIGVRDDRTIRGLTRLEMLFGTTAASTGYNLTLRFENGCEVSASR